MLQLPTVSTIFNTVLRPKRKTPSTRGSTRTNASSATSSTTSGFIRPVASTARARARRIAKRLCETIDGDVADVDLAVQAARTAFVSWSALSPHERAKHLYSIARHVQKHHRLLACVESLDNGKSIRETRDSDIPLVARHFYHHAGWAQLMDEEMRGWKPLGVIGEIVPWNFPLMLLAWKVCPALAMGNTVVVKPASYTRLSALLFAEICAEAGLPPGVFNVISGSGAIGSDLADHPDVDKVAFTGSTPIGRVLRRRIAGSGKKLSLELGGKSPVIVFDNADLDAVTEGIVDAIFFNQGQVCSAGSRLIVQEAVHDKLLAKLKRRIDKFRVGHPLDKNIDMGALVDESQYTTIKSFVDNAVAEGADVYVARVPVPNNGWYWPPTIISNVQPVSFIDIGWCRFFVSWIHYWTALLRACSSSIPQRDSFSFFWFLFPFALVSNNYFLSNHVGFRVRS
jgi:aldehyde dehydrogenase (NAD+)